MRSAGKFSDLVSFIVIYITVEKGVGQDRNTATREKEADLILIIYTPYEA